MGEAWAYAGAVLLAAATLPQAIRLFRTRSAVDFDWTFIALNFLGITFLAVRAIELTELGFVIANSITAGFWLLVGIVKAGAARAPVGAPPTT